MLWLLLLLSLLCLSVCAFSQRHRAVTFSETCSCHEDTLFCHGAMEHHQYFRCSDNSAVRYCTQSLIGKSESDSVENVAGVADVDCECIRENCEAAYDMNSHAMNESCLEDCETWANDNECAEMNEEKYQCST